jgi:hypothetical protein
MTRFGKKELGRQQGSVATGQLKVISEEEAAPQQH